MDRMRAPWRLPTTPWTPSDDDARVPPSSHPRPTLGMARIALEECNTESKFLASRVDLQIA